MTILIIGGDHRMIFAKRELEKAGFSVEILNTPENIGAIKGADVVLLPVPVTRDGVNINCLFTDKKLPLNILKDINKNTKVFGGGKLDLDNYTNYLALDEYAIKNAALTAEGAISHAIENTCFSLWKSNILIIGYGRVGRALQSRLSGFYPNLTVSARSEHDFAALGSLGIKHIKTENLKENRQDFDIVFNTVDIKLDEPVAAALSGTLFIDLSTSGGFENNAASLHDIEYKKLPGIPAICAPETAGKIIAETVISKIKG